MATKALLANGKTITVDNSQIDIKFTRSVDQLNNSLSRAQSSLGLYYDNQSRLVDVLGRCVEGLSLSQIRLGMWVDELGRARTITGGFAEGLTRTQLELGYYDDGLGAICDRLGNYIGQSKAAIKAEEEHKVFLERQAEAEKKALNEQFEARQRARQALGEAAGAIAASSSQFAVLIATLEGVDKTANGTHHRIIGLAQGVATAAATAQTAFNAYRGFSELQKNGHTIFSNFTANLNAAGKAWRGYAAGALTAAEATRAAMASIGPAAVAIGALSLGIGAAFLTGRKNAETVDGLTEIEKEAKKAGREVKTLADALEFGAFNPKNATSEIRRAVDELNRLNAEGLTSEQSQALEDSWNGVSRAINRAGFAVDNFFSSSQLEKEKKDQFAAINSYIAGIEERNKTNADKIADEIKTLRLIANEGSLTGNQRATIRAEIARQEEALAKAKADEANAAIQKAEKEKSDLAQKLGVSFEIERTPQEQLALTLKELSSAREKEVITVEEQARAEAKARDRYRDALEKEAGVSFEVEKTAQEQLASTLDKLTKAREQELITVEEQARAEAKARDRYLESLEKEVGVSFAKEATKDPLEVLKNKESRLDEELKAGRINDEQFKTAKKNAQKEARDALALEVPKETQTPPAKFELVKVGKIDAAKTDEELQKATDEIKAQIKRLFENDAVASKEYEAAQKEAARELEARTITAREYALKIADAANATAKAANGAPEAFASYSATVDEATRALQYGVISEQEKNAIIAEADDALAKARRDAAKSEIEAARDRLGIDALIADAEQINAAKKDVAQRLKEQATAIKKARDAGEISDAEFRKAQQALTTIRNKQADEERERARENARSALGVDNLMESLKTPLEKFAETTAKIDDAMKTGAIDRKEADALLWKARGDLFAESDKMVGNVDKVESLKSTLENLAPTLKSGSNELYLAQIRNTTSYQSSIKTTTERLDQTTQATLDQARQTNYWLEQVANGGASTFYGA